MWMPKSVTLKVFFGMLLSAACSEQHEVDELHGRDLETIEEHFNTAGEHIQRGLERIDETSQRLDGLVNTLQHHGSVE